MQFAVGARTVECARVKDFISRFEQRDFFPHGFYGTGGIESKYSSLAWRRSRVDALLDVDRIDGHGTYADSEIVRKGFEHIDFKVDEGVIGKNRLRDLISNRFHSSQFVWPH